MTDYIAKLLRREKKQEDGSRNRDSSNNNQKQRMLKKKLKKMKKLKKRKRNERKLLNNKQNNSNPKRSKIHQNNNKPNRIDSDSESNDDNVEDNNVKNNNNNNNNRIDSDSSSDDDDDDDDAAPPRRPPPTTTMTETLPNESKNRLDSDSDSDSDDAAPPRRKPGMKDGSKAGLVHLKQYEEDQARNEKKRNELDKKIFNDNQPMETIYRDKDGNQLSASAAFEKKQKLEKEQKELEKKQKIMNNLGAVQMKESIKNKKMFEDIKKSTFSRYKNDKQLQKELKSRQRVDDPMAKFVHNEGNNSSSSTSNIKNINPNNVPLKQALPNRFKIKPGYRWDGVDRGNGFEMRLLHSISKKKIDEERKYVYASRNM